MNRASFPWHSRNEAPHRSSRSSERKRVPNELSLPGPGSERLVRVWLPIAAILCAGVLGSAGAEACSVQLPCITGHDETSRLNEPVLEKLLPGLDMSELGGGSPTAALVTSRPFEFSLEASAGQGSRDDWTVGVPDPDHDDYYAYRLPYGNAVSYPVLQSYGSKLSHRGAEFFTLDFQMAEGTEVHAARGGVVALVEESHSEGCWEELCARLANYVVILHADGTTGEYFHLHNNGVAVRPGDRVSAGDFIAFSGNTGYSTTPHLHFGVYGARARGRTQSIGVRFVTHTGIVREPRRGARYLNAPINQP